MTEVVVDANVLLNLALPGHPYHAQAHQLFADCLTAQIVLIAPPAFQAEVDSAIRHSVHLQHLSKPQGELTYRIVDSLPITILGGHAMRLRARQIAEQLQHSRVYDATYIALALERRCDFWTADQRLYNGASPAYSCVHFLGSYATGFYVPVAQP